MGADRWLSEHHSGLHAAGPERFPGNVREACCIGAAYWFASSTSFASLVVTIGRAFTDTFAGVAPGSVAPFRAAQLTGGAVTLGLTAAFFGRRVGASGPSERRDPRLAHGGL